MAKPLSVADLMSRNPITVQPDTPLREVLNLMRRDDCRQLPVVDANGSLVGIVTDRDVRLAMNSPLTLRERWQDTELLESVTAEGCMSADPVTVGADSPAYLAAEMLITYKFGALPVVEADSLVGIISVTDFLQYFSEEQRRGSGAWQEVESN